MFQPRIIRLCALALGHASAIDPRGPHGRARQRAISCTRPATPAGLAELVDALVLGTIIARCGGSSPFARTIFAMQAGIMGSSAALGGVRYEFLSKDKIKAMKTVETLNKGLKRVRSEEHTSEI